MNKKLISLLLISALIHSTIIFTNWNIAEKSPETEKKQILHGHLSKAAASPTIASPSQSPPKKQEISTPLEEIARTPIFEGIKEAKSRPPQLRIGPNLAISIDNDEEESCNLFLEINEHGRVKNAIIIGKTKIPQGIQETIMTAFKNEAIFIPSTDNGTPSPGHIILEITLSKSP